MINTTFSIKRFINRMLTFRFAFGRSWRFCISRSWNIETKLKNLIEEAGGEQPFLNRTSNYLHHLYMEN